MIKKILEANKNIINNQDPAEIEFDFFNQDTGVDYEDI